MIDTDSHRNQAEVAQASYARLQLGPTESPSNLFNLGPSGPGGMSFTQATEFAKRYLTVVAEYDDDVNGANIGRGCEHRDQEPMAVGRAGSTRNDRHISLIAPALVLFGRHSCVLALVLSLAGCMGWAPGRKAYWDDQVRQMCQKDGGVQIFERLRVSSTDLQYLASVNGKIGVAVKELAHPRAAAYAITEESTIRKQDPLVLRHVSNIVRRADGKTVARWIAYSRIGGDFPSPSHESQFTCPGLKDIATELQRLFIVEETPR